MGFYKSRLYLKSVSLQWQSADLLSLPPVSFSAWTKSSLLREEQDETDLELKKKVYGHTVVAFDWHCTSYVVQLSWKSIYCKVEVLDIKILDYCRFDFYSWLNHQKCLAFRQDSHIFIYDVDISKSLSFHSNVSLWKRNKQHRWSSSLPKYPSVKHMVPISANRF